MKKIAVVITALLLALCLTACGEVTFPSITEVFMDNKPGESDEKISLEYKVGKIGEKSEPKKTEIPRGEPHVIKLSLKENVVIVPVGKTGKIEHTIEPAKAYDPSVYYVSSDESIVSVDKDGKVLAKKPGAVNVVVRTNDQGFRRTCVVISTWGNGNEKVSSEVVKLINDAREKNGYPKTADTNKSLQAAANHRAFEEAVDIINYGDTKMDNVRMIEQDGKRLEAENDIFTDFNIFSKSSKAVYIWGRYTTAKQVYQAFIEDDDCAEALGVRGSGQESYEFISVGCFEFDGISYWSILMTTE